MIYLIGSIAAIFVLGWLIVEKTEIGQELKKEHGL